MTKVPSLKYTQVISALKHIGFRVVRQKGSHIRLEKSVDDRTIKLTIPAHNPIKRSTLSQILKEARISVDELKSLL